MKHTVDIPFAVGSKVWWIGPGYHEETVTCPECLGARFLLLISGNGEHVKLDCNLCQRGYDPPRGVIKQITWQSEPEEMTLGPVEIQNWHGSEVKYRYSLSGGRSADASDLFDILGDCLAACIKRNEARDVVELNNLDATIESKRRNLAFSVHYWKREVKDLERRLERAKARLGMSIEKKKEDK